MSVEEVLTSAWEYMPLTAFVKLEQRVEKLEQKVKALLGHDTVSCVDADGKRETKTVAELLGVEND